MHKIPQPMTTYLLVDNCNYKRIFFFLHSVLIYTLQGDFFVWLVFLLKPKPAHHPPRMLFHSPVTFYLDFWKGLDGYKPKDHYLCLRMPQLIFKIQVSFKAWFPREMGFYQLCTLAFRNNFWLRWPLPVPSDRRSETSRFIKRLNW